MSTTYSLSANTFRSSILSGIAVGIAGWGYLACRSKGLEAEYDAKWFEVVGAVLFSFGLLTVVNYKLKLYTGTAGFVSLRKEDGSCRFFRAIAELLFILLGNITGCMLVALLLRCSPNDLGLEQAKVILEGRLALGPLKAGALAIGCGFIMTTVVTFAREGKPLALLFGVPLFIYCGFPHCLADAFYYMAAPLSYTGEHLWEIVALYPCLVIGNFVGCNLYRFLNIKED